MSWTIVKINTKGSQERYLEEELDVDNWKNLDLSEYKLLKKLDPYGDTTFKPEQLDDLKSDLEMLAGLIKSDAIQEIINLINECKNEPMTHVKFYGD